MRRTGKRYIGGKGAPLFSEAMRTMLRDQLIGEQYILGVVLDRGERKGYGMGTRYSGPNGWDGEPVYWLRKVTWTNVK